MRCLNMKHLNTNRLDVDNCVKVSSVCEKGSLLCALTFFNLTIQIQQWTLYKS